MKHNTGEQGFGFLDRKLLAWVYPDWAYAYGFLYKLEALRPCFLRARAATENER